MMQGKNGDAVTLAKHLAIQGPTDSHIISILQNIFTQLDCQEEELLMYEAICKKRPASEEFLNAWFVTMIDRRNLKGQQKAAMLLHKSLSAKNRSYSLYAVHSTYLAYKSASISESEAKIFPMLALRIMESLKPFKNDQEAYLYAVILDSQDKTAQAIEFLVLKQTQQWDSLDISLLLVQLLEKAKDWQLLYDTSLSVLNKRDDWIHWKYLIQSAINLGKPESALQVIESYNKSRNSSLALIHFRQTEGPGKLIEAVVRYFNAYGTRRSAFPDLLPYVQDLSLDWLGQVDSSSISENINWQVNVEKLRFLNRPTNYDLPTMVRSQIQNYQSFSHLLTSKDVKDYHPGDDFIILAALSLVESRENELLAIEKAIILLEYAVQNDQHQFYLRVWLIRLYLLLGCWDLAFGHFNSLSIKKIQNDTLAHHIITRISSLDPVRGPLKDAGEIYEPSEHEDISQYIALAYEKGVFTQIEEFIDLRQKLDNSITKGIIDVEINRISRMENKRGKLLN